MADACSIISEDKRYTPSGVDYSEDYSNFVKYYSINIRKIAVK